MSVTDAIRIKTANDAPTIASNFCRQIFDDYEIKTQVRYGEINCLVEVHPFSIDFKPYRPARVAWAEYDIDNFGFVPNFQIVIFYSRSAQNWIQNNGGYDIPPLRNPVLKAVLGLIKSTDYSLILRLDEREREVLIRHDGKLTLLDDPFWTEDRLRSFADIPYETGKLAPWPDKDALYIESQHDLETVTKRFCEQAFEDFHIHSYRKEGTNTAVFKAVSNDIEVNTVEYGHKYRQCHHSHQRNLGFVPNIFMSIYYRNHKALDDYTPEREAVVRGTLGLIKTTDYCLALTFSTRSGIALQYKPGTLPLLDERHFSDKLLRLLDYMPYLAEDVPIFRYYPSER